MTGFAAVGKIRFEDGSIWKADKEALINEIMKLHPELKTLPLNAQI